MSQPKVLITSSTGNVGKYLSKALHRENIPFIAATRNAAQAQQQFGFTPQTVFLDFKDPSTFPGALKGMELLFLCGPSATPGAEKLLVPLVEEAEKQGIKQVVFIASYPNIMEMIEQSSMAYTFLRGNFFMQNFEIYQTGDIRDHKRIFMPAGKGKAPFIHTRDIGEVAAVVLQDPGKYKGQTLYLTGPETIDHFRAAEIFSEVLGEVITYENPDDDTYRKELLNKGFSREYIDAMIAVFGKIRRGRVKQKSDTVEQILGRSPISLKEYAEEMKDHFS